MGDKLKTTQYSATGENKGWNVENNRWQTDTEFATIQQAAASQKAQANSDAMANAVQNFKGEEFKFDPNNPQLSAMKQSLAYGAENQKTNLAQQMAQRGMSSSGAALRANARTDQQLGSQVADITGQNWQSQLAQNTQKNQTLWNQQMGKFQVANDVYKQAQDNYYNSLTQQTQEAMTQYQRNRQGFEDTMTVINTAANLTNAVGNVIPG